MAGGKERIIDAAEMRLAATGLYGVSTCRIAAATPNGLGTLTQTQ